MDENLQDVGAAVHGGGELSTEDETSVHILIEHGTILSTDAAIRELSFLQGRASKANLH